MPIEYVISLSYSEVYNDYDSVNVKDLVKDIPTKMALELVCHYTGQIHTQERNPEYQLSAIRTWYQRFDDVTKHRIEKVIDEYLNKGQSHFNFIDNVSSLYLIELLLANSNNLPIVDDLTPTQEENLFKAYLFFASKWTNEQEKGAKKYLGNEAVYMPLVMLLPYSELFEAKDFRIQFLKSVYFFKFCQDDALFSTYLVPFLSSRRIENWKQYLFNLCSVYVTILQKDAIKTVLDFPADNKNVFSSLETFCVDPNTFKPTLDFMTLREKPIYKFSNNKLMFLNINFLIDKIYQSVIFDFADVLISTKQAYKGNIITSKPQFLGIFGDEFIERGMFYKLMKHVFRQKDYKHYTGNDLKDKFGDGAPDYLIIDNSKIYVFEFKNAIFSGSVKYSFDIDAIKKEIDKKLVQNDKGRAKGITQLINFIEAFVNGRYDTILQKSPLNYIIYPVLVTTDYTFILSGIYSIVLDRYNEILRARGLGSLNLKKPTLIDLDSIIKFQDFFIDRKLTINHVLNDYQTYLSRGTNSVDKSLSFQKYMHDKTSKSKYDSPKMFSDEIGVSLF